VLLPAEGRVYRARESMLHVLAEIQDWLSTHLGEPRPAAARRAGAQGGAGAKGGVACGPLDELRGRMREILAQLAGPLDEALVLAVRTAVSKHPGPPSGR